MIRRLVPVLAVATLAGCIVPVYGTGSATNVYCSPNGVCADGGSSGGGSGASSTSGAASSGGSSGSATGTGGSTGSSTSGGGSSGTSSGGSCGPHAAGTELKPCSRASDCDCPEECLGFDGGSKLCQTPCTSFEDCGSLERCSNGFCAYVTCMANAVFSPCTAGNDDAGWCLPASADNGASVDLCFPSGTSTTTCIPATTGAPWKNWTAAGSCEGGSLCDPSGTCVTDCVLGETSCTSGSSCVAIDFDPLAGFCEPCPGGQTSCGLSCFDPLTDDLHCGGGSGVGSCSEGVACRPGTVCLAGSCTRPAPLRTQRYGLAAASGPDGLIYLVGGLSAGKPTGVSETFDPHTNVWTSLPALPTPRGELGVAWGSDGLLHAVGGLTVELPVPTVSERNEAYDPTAGVWSATGAPLLDYRFGAAVASDPAGLLYVAGGGAGFGVGYAPSNTLLRDDPTQLDGGWLELEPMANNRVYTAGAFAADGRFIVMGGEDHSGNALDSVEAYDAGANFWDGTIPALPQPLAYLGAAAQGQILYAVGGGTTLPDGGFVGQAAVYQLDLDTCGSGCTWQPIADLQQARGGHAVALGADGRLYAFGGLGQFNPNPGNVEGYLGLPSVEIYDPNQPDGGWVSSVCPFGQVFETPDASYPAGAGTGTELAVGNLNTDAFPDAVVLSGGSIVPLINDKNGGFAGGTAISADAGPDGLHGLALADFNRDGRLDAVAVSPDLNTLVLAEGDGNGGFASVSLFPTSDGGQTGGPLATAVADFNGDGWPDVAVADTGGSAVSMLLGTNFLTFIGFGLSSFQTCANPTQIAAADLNGDGNPDLVVLCAPGSAGVVQLWINGGSGATFSLAGQLTVLSPTAIGLADLNLDGLPDIAVAALDGSSSVVIPFLNQGGATPTFLAGTGGTVGANSDPWSLVVADVNGDGYPDLLAVDSTARTVYPFLNQLGFTGTFLAIGNYPTAPNDTPIAAAAADLRNDGWNDLLVLNQAGNSVSVSLSSCPP